LQQAVRETAGGSADVEADFTGNVDVPLLKRFLKLESSTANVLQVFAQQADISVCVYARTRFFYFLAVDQNLARQDQCLRPLARTRQAALQQQFVDPDFQNVSGDCCVIEPPTYTKVPATNLVQGVEPCLAELLTKILPGFSTEFFTEVLKTIADVSFVHLCVLRGG
jgi:hypothetical protein